MKTAGQGSAVQGHPSPFLTTGETKVSIAAQHPSKKTAGFNVILLFNVLILSENVLSPWYWAPL